MRRLVLLLTLILLTAACSLTAGFDPMPTSAPAGGEEAVVTRVIDGDTIDVRLGDGQIARVRYIGVDTPERDEPCFAEATAANTALVDGQRVRLVMDVSNTDRFDRLLRYVWVGSTFVNRELVAQGWAQAVLFEPNRAHYETFRDLEQQAARANIGCHPTGVFR
jgi:endonuclease YncB( thermonuclease family)